MAKAAKPVPDGFHTVTPHLTLDNAAETIDWYKRALGAEEIGRNLGPDGKIMHAEIKIGNSRLYVNDVMQGSKGPKAHGGSPAAFWRSVATRRSAAPAPTHNSRRARCVSPATSLRLEGATPRSLPQ